MEEEINCKSSNNLRGKLLRTSLNLVNNTSTNDNLRDKKSLYNFISSKNKLILKSCFDYKGAKKFLSEKEKAMAEFVLSDEILDIDEENKAKNNSNHQKRRKTKEKTNFRMKSEDALIYIKNHKRHKSTKSKKKLKKMSEKTVSIHYPEENEKEKKNKDKLNEKNNKKKFLKLNSILSNFSNIQHKEPMDLTMNNDDSFIHNIINEMVKFKN